eukprot:4176978-Pyramimonas_sp.AAC.1
MQPHEAPAREIFTDGSCLKPGGHKKYNVAGWSVVAIDGHGDVFACLVGRVGRYLPPASPAAER